MKEEERIAVAAPVLFIQRFDALPGQVHQRLVLRQRLCGSIPKISEQAEVQVLTPICEEPDFQRLDQSRDVFGLVSIVGTTTRVLDSGGIPSEKSRRGNGLGFTSNVANQFTNAIAR
jgi:hypothetical protein